MKVSDLLRLVHDDGWFLVATRGSHRQFRDAEKPGRVTVPGKPRERFGARDSSTVSSSRPVSGKTKVTAMRYAVVIENASSNFSAYVPDLPGCIATGATLSETEAAIREASCFISMGCERTVRRSRRQRARSNTSRLPPDTSLERARGRYGAMRRVPEPQLDC